MALSCPLRISPFLITCCACASNAAPTKIVRTTAASPDSLPKSLLVMCPRLVSKQRALPHGRGQRAFIEIIELAADRHAMGKSRHLDTCFLQEIGDVMRGGLAVYGCIQCQNDFRHPRIVRARHQRVDGQVLRADAIERR